MDNKLLLNTEHELATEKDVELLLKQMAGVDDIIENTEKDLKSKKKILDSIKKKRDKAEEMILAYYLNQKELDEEYELNPEFAKVTSTTRDKWDYTDEQKIINQLKQINPKLVRVKEELDKNKFKATYEVVNGQVYDEDNDDFIDGVEVKRNTTYSVKILCTDLV